MSPTLYRASGAPAVVEVSRPLRTETGTRETRAAREARRESCAGTKAVGKWLGPITENSTRRSIASSKACQFRCRVYFLFLFLDFNLGICFQGSLITIYTQPFCLRCRVDCESSCIVIRGAGWCHSVLVSAFIWFAHGESRSIDSVCMYFSSRCTA
jgi:hypothetical protein